MPNRWLLSRRVLCNDLELRSLALGIEEGRIREIRAWDGTTSPRDLRAAVTNYGDAPIVPGWVNSHVHLAMAPLRGITSRLARRGNVVVDVFFRVESRMTRDDVLLFTRLAALEGLFHGTTEVWDHYYFGDAVAEALLEVGMTGTVAPTLQDLSGPGADGWDKALETTKNIAENRRLALSGINAAVGVHASDTCSPALLERAGDLARRYELPVHLHLLQNAEEICASAVTYPEGISKGVLSRLGKTELLVAHALHATQTDITQLTNAGAVLAFCPLSQGQFGLLSPIAEWREAGGHFALGTDSVASNDSLDLQRELASLAGMPGIAASFKEERRAVLRSRDLSEQLTAVLALERERKRLTTAAFPLEPMALLPSAWGFPLPGGPRGIQEGAWANCLVLDPNHPSLFPEDQLARSLCCGSLTGAIHQVYCQGREMFPESGNPHSLLEQADYGLLLAEARKRTRELLSAVSA